MSMIQELLAGGVTGAGWAPNRASGLTRRHKSRPDPGFLTPDFARLGRFIVPSVRRTLGCAPPFSSQLAVGWGEERTPTKLPLDVGVRYRLPQSTGVTIQVGSRQRARLETVSYDVAVPSRP